MALEIVGPLLNFLQSSKLNYPKPIMVICGHQASIFDTHLGHAHLLHKIIFLVSNLLWTCLNLMIVSMWVHKWQATISCDAFYICSLKCKIAKSIALSMLKPTLTCLCHGVVCYRVGLPCVHLSCAMPPLSFLFLEEPCSICFVSITTLILVYTIGHKPGKVHTYVTFCRNFFLFK